MAAGWCARRLRVRPRRLRRARCWAGPPLLAEALSYRIGPAPGKGLGAFAARPFAAGDLVIADPPLLRVARPLDSERIHAALEELPAEAREEFWGLSDSAEAKTPEGVFNCNYFEMDGDGGVYRVICRFNHSCAPNCIHSFNAERGVGELRAARDVVEGEELCVTYTELCRPRAERRRELRDGYGFVCRCEACAGPRPGSDERRAALRDLDALLGDLVQPLHALAALRVGAGSAAAGPAEVAELMEEAAEARAEGLRVAREVLRVAAEEGHTAAAADGLDARACASAVFLLQGCRQPQEQWAKRCIDLYAVGGGPAETEGLRRQLEDIMAQPALLPPPAAGDLGP